MQMRDLRLCTFSGNPEGKISAQGETGKENRAALRKACRLFDGLKDFIKQGGKEKALIEVMGEAVIPQVQSEQIIAVPIQQSSGCQHVGGVGTALPTVDKNDKAFFRRGALWRK